MSDDVLSVLLDDFVSMYAPRTAVGYRRQLGRYLRWCASEGVAPLSATRTDVERFARYLLVDVGLSGGSVYQSLVPIRGFYRFGHCEGAIDKDPAVYARRPPPRFSTRDTLGLDRDQLRTLLTAAVAIGDRHHGATFLLGCMALHASEACSLRVEDYAQTLRGHRVLKFVGKAGVPAQLPLPVPVVRALDAAAGDRATGPLLTRRDGAAMTRHNLNILLRTVARRAGLRDLKVTSDVLRRSAITNALEAGASIRKVQDLARHGEPRTTMRYEKNRTSLDDHAVHALVAFLAPVEGPSPGA